MQRMYKMIKYSSHSTSLFHKNAKSAPITLIKNETTACTLEKIQTI